MPMQLLLCSATEMEIRPILNNPPAYEGLDIIITGVGLTAATYSITKNVIEKRPDLVVQAGLAGSLDKSLSPAEVVLVESDCIGDLGVEENGTFVSIGDLLLQDPNGYPWINGKLQNNFNNINDPGLKKVSSVTVNEISTSTARINYYRDVLGAQLETMEGAALHYVCLMEKIPFLQVRSLSNIAGERDKTKWQTDLAIARLNDELEKILSKFFKP